MQDSLFDALDALPRLVVMQGAELDALEIGVIGFDAHEMTTVYNAPEARWAGLSRTGVIGTRLFQAVAPCMDNYLVAEALRRTRQEEMPLDRVPPYVLTLRMRPTPVTLRLLSSPDVAMRFILIRRK